MSLPGEPRCRKVRFGVYFEGSREDLLDEGMWGVEEYAKAVKTPMHWIEQFEGWAPYLR